MLKETFHIELQAHRGLFEALARQLAKASTSSLRGTALVIRGGCSFDLLSATDERAICGNALVIELDPHLDALSAEFGFAEPTRQLRLFPMVAVQ